MVRKCEFLLRETADGCDCFGGSGQEEECSVLSGRSLCFSGKLGAYKQLSKSESLTAGFCAGKACTGHVLIQEPPVGQELLTLVNILPHRCSKVSIKVYQS